MFTNFIKPGSLAFASALVASSALLGGPSYAAIIGVQFIGDGRATMASDDLAGAPGVRVGNWNNLSGASLDDTAILDDGTTIGGGFSVTPSDTSFANRGNPSDNDEFLFNSVKDVIDPFDVNVTNVPFAQYDLYIYRRSENDPRAGGFSVDDGSTIYYARSVPGSHASNPDSTGSGYVQSFDTTFPVGTVVDGIDVGNFVVIPGLTASNFTLTATAYGDDIPRNKFAGFQIVNAVPEPASLGLAMLCGAGVLSRRQR